MTVLLPVPLPTRDAPNGCTPPAESLRIAHGPLRRGERHVLDAAELTIPAGSVVALAGANGAGKSTLFLALAGALPRRSGWAQATRGERPLRSIGFVPQHPALPWWATGWELAAVHGVSPLLVRGAPASLDLPALLARRADVLSAGQTQTVSVAIALLRGDPLLLLDEPFASVDLHHRRGLRDLLRQHQARRPGGVVIISSHAAGDLRALCDWVVTLRNGSRTFAGSRSELERASDSGRGGTVPEHQRAEQFEQRLAELTG